jgi:hypothetical protein
MPIRKPRIFQQVRRIDLRDLAMMLERFIGIGRQPLF